MEGTFWACELAPLERARPSSGLRHHGTCEEITESSRCASGPVLRTGEVGRRCRTHCQYLAAGANSGQAIGILVSGANIADSAPTQPHRVFGNPAREWSQRLGANVEARARDTCGYLH
jgi:hypothetical protein